MMGKTKDISETGDKVANGIKISTMTYSYQIRDLGHFWLSFRLYNANGKSSNNSQLTLGFLLNRKQEKIPYKLKIRIIHIILWSTEQ